MSTFSAGDVVLCPGGYVGVVDDSPSPFPEELLVRFDEFVVFEDGCYKAYSAKTETLSLICRMAER